MKTRWLRSRGQFRSSINNTDPVLIAIYFNRFNSETEVLRLEPGA